MFLSSFHEALRQGSEAFCWEVELTAKPWKFDLGTIGVPTTVWHGDQDTSTPLAMGQTFARAIPGSTLRVLPGEGHLVFLSRWKEILDDLTVSPA